MLYIIVNDKIVIYLFCNSKTSLFIFIDMWAYFEYNKSTEINTRKCTFFRKGGINYAGGKICKCPG